MEGGCQTEPVGQGAGRKDIWGVEGRLLSLLGGKSLTQHHKLARFPKFREAGLAWFQCTCARYEECLYRIVKFARDVCTGGRDTKHALCFPQAYSMWKAQARSKGIRVALSSIRRILSRAFWSWRRGARRDDERESPALLDKPGGRVLEVWGRALRGRIAWREGLVRAWRCWAGAARDSREVAMANNQHSLFMTALLVDDACTCRESATNEPSVRLWNTAGVLPLQPFMLKIKSKQHEITK